MALTQTALPIAEEPFKTSPSDPAPISRHFYSDLRAEQTPTNRYASHVANYNLHLPYTTRYQVSRPVALQLAVEDQHDYFDQNYRKLLLQYEEGLLDNDESCRIAKALGSLKRDWTEGDIKRALFKACQRDSGLKVSRSGARDGNRKMSHGKRALRRKVQADFEEAVKFGERLDKPLEDGGDDEVDELEAFEGYWGALVDQAVEKAEKKGKKVMKDWKEVEAQGGFWKELGEEEWERIVLEEEMIFADGKEESGEKLGSDWDWALVSDQSELSS